jgi:hypothetical protein
VPADAVVEESILTCTKTSTPDVYDICTTKDGVQQHTMFSGYSILVMRANLTPSSGKILEPARGFYREIPPSKAAVTKPELAVCVWRGCLLKSQRTRVLPDAASSTREAAVEDRA